MDNIRKFLNFNKSYFLKNREERNFAAILYHALLINNNIEKFLKLIDCNYSINESEFAIYFEYSFIRDIWFNINGSNEIKRNLILQNLNLSNNNYLTECSVEDFNKYFGAVPKPSAEYIQSPGNWSITLYKNSILSNEEFLDVSLFKWAFNAKPDIVIHLSNNTAVCIEAKYECSESYYPTKSSERNEFFRRNLSLVSQTALQKKILTELLGIETHFLFLIQKGSLSKTHKTIFWKDVFKALDFDNCPYFITEWIKRF